MKKHSFPLSQRLSGLFSLLLVFLISGHAHSQCAGVPNPVFPGCQAPGGPFKVLLVLDESGSIGNAPGGFEDEVENAVTGFANTLAAVVPSTGKMQMGIVEFSNSASTPMGLTDVKSSGFLGAVSNYLTGDGGPNPNYNPNVPGALTNFEAALLEARKTPDLDFIFFITDGNPTTGGNINTWRGIANGMKSAGTYIFGVAIGTGINRCNIIALSGPDELGNPSSFQQGADWAQTNFGQLATDLVGFANSLIDTEAPVIACPSAIRNLNDPGKCGKTLTFTINVNDNCPNVSLISAPPSGSFFNVGETNVSATATDGVGNTATCSFKVTILDLEAPQITCPANLLLSCEASLAPGNTGTPTTADNCAIAAVLSEDLRIDGSCPNDFTIPRPWTANDVHGNASTCLQDIELEDKKSPVITCPANTTVTCDTSVAKTGLATATDNCDPSVQLSHRDIPISGDCEWFCVTERHWTATDDCRNTSKCVQVITKDVTPLIEQALASGPLVWGQTAATVTLPAARAACVVKWLPYTGVTPTALKFDDAVAGADCKLMTNPLDDAGRIVNPMLGEAMKLKILVRLNPALGTTKLSTIPCTMHFIVRQALAPNPDVNELLRVTDLTLGNVNVNLLVPAHAIHLLDVLKCVNAGRTVCKP